MCGVVLRICCFELELIRNGKPSFLSGYHVKMPFYFMSTCIDNMWEIINKFKRNRSDDEQSPIDNKYVVNIRRKNTVAYAHIVVVSFSILLNE